MLVGPPTRSAPSLKSIFLRPCSSSELLYLSSQVLQEYYTRKVWEKNIVVTLHTGILYISTSELQFKKRDVLNQYVGVAPSKDTPPAATFIGNRSTACIIVLHDPFPPPRERERESFMLIAIKVAYVNHQIFERWPSMCTN